MFTVALDPESTDGHCTALCLNKEELAYLTKVFGTATGNGLLSPKGSSLFFQTLSPEFQRVIGLRSGNVKLDIYTEHVTLIPMKHDTVSNRIEDAHMRMK